eukprot:scaffold2784_cov109-Cylindrotheca_fusiformis.AAC.1
MTDDLLLQFGGEDDDNASNGSFSWDANDWSQVAAVPPHQVQMQLQQHPHLNLLQQQQQQQQQSQQQQKQPNLKSFGFSSSEENSNLFAPTPIGRSCQVVHNKGQVPLNQSLLSQSESLAGMLRRLEEEKAMFNSRNRASAASLMPSLGSLFAASAAPFSAAPSTTGTSFGAMTEADFGPVGCPSSASSTTGANSVSNASASSNSSEVDAAAISNRSQQSSRWNQRFQELLDYKNRHGDCNVPYLWPHNRPLSEWVKRQRHQFKLKMEGRHSALTEKRQGLLTQIGFVWNSRASLWDSRYQELVEYYQEFGNVRVTKKTSKHRALSVWLKRQRHAARLFLTGDDSTCMDQDRLQKLLDLGVKITKSS